MGRGSTPSHGGKVPPPSCVGGGCGSTPSCKGEVPTPSCGEELPPPPIREDPPSHGGEVPPPPQEERFHPFPSHGKEVPSPSHTKEVPSPSHGVHDETISLCGDIWLSDKEEVATVRSVVCGLGRYLSFFRNVSQNENMILRDTFLRENQQYVEPVARFYSSNYKQPGALNLIRNSLGKSAKNVLPITLNS